MTFEPGQTEQPLEKPATEKKITPVDSGYEVGETEGVSKDTLAILGLRMLKNYLKKPLFYDNRHETGVGDEEHREHTEESETNRLKISSLTAALGGVELILDSADPRIDEQTRADVNEVYKKIYQRLAADPNKTGHMTNQDGRDVELSAESEFNAMKDPLQKISEGVKPVDHLCVQLLRHFKVNVDGPFPVQKL